MHRLWRDGQLWVLVALVVAIVTWAFFWHPELWP
jgi:hypothetical protein